MSKQACSLPAIIGALLLLCLLFRCSASAGDGGAAGVEGIGDACKGADRRRDNMRIKRDMVLERNELKRKRMCGEGAHVAVAYVERLYFGELLAALLVRSKKKYSTDQEHHQV
ncbi:hypothetical protein Zm00014a_040689 [Zea mays]|uniref:Uncharacterized protein n=1 Tax=Zea mays TaxID=4577 RepID=A0A3L6EIM1_MAIZE|nr:hypothetical protein Zm00014a_040689 [Zea mays]